jgi:hypothetical protein
LAKAYIYNMLINIQTILPGTDKFYLSLFGLWPWCTSSMLYWTLSPIYFDPTGNLIERWLQGNYGKEEGISATT